MEVFFFVLVIAFEICILRDNGIVVNGDVGSSSKKQNEEKHNWSLNLIHTTEHFILIEIQAHSKNTR